MIFICLYEIPHLHSFGGPIGKIMMPASGPRTKLVYHLWGSQMPGLGTMAMRLRCPDPRAILNSRLRYLVPGNEKS